MASASQAFIKYRILKEFAVGGMGTIYLARVAAAETSPKGGPAHP